MELYDQYNILLNVCTFSYNFCKSLSNFTLIHSSSILLNMPDDPTELSDFRISSFKYILKMASKLL